MEIGKALEIAKKDVRVEIRSKNTINFMILFALVTCAMFSISVPINLVGDVAPALLWLIFLFVGMNGYARAFLREVEDKTLDGLKMSADPGTILLGKMFYNLFLMFMIEIIVLPVFIGLFDLNISSPLMVFVSVTAGNTGFVVVSSSLSILVIKSRARELLLPVILFPVIFPVITSTISALSLSISGAVVEEVMPSLLMIGIYSITMFTISLLTVEQAFID